ncbi:hypothetical protein ALC57_18204 [Trachymyrmex cornetzi]|uniref:Uncharacterized protein n=1 Tax=Trachymyrmex cornetzi TaxID=471704 RepID=A0A195D9X4_9HYME|nr:hypothetical protein ALC57_18204 [Trachymyrmex cornetzi]
MRRASLRVAPRMQPGFLFCWCVIATVTLALAAWQENVRPKMYVQLAGRKQRPRRVGVLRIKGDHWAGTARRDIGTEFAVNFNERTWQSHNNFLNQKVKSGGAARRGASSENGGLSGSFVRVLLKCGLGWSVAEPNSDATGMGNAFSGGGLIVIRNSRGDMSNL